MFTYFKLEKFVDTLFIVTKTDYLYPRENERSQYGISRSERQRMEKAFRF
jgi:hypothetical protein